MRHADAVDTLQRRVVDGPGVTDPALRQAAFSGDDLPADLTTFIEKVRRNAYKVTDDDITRLLEAGYSQDEIFEVTIAAALGAGVARYRAGVEAMERR